MKHFSPSEFVDFVEGTLPAARAVHVDGCDDCRAQVAAVRDALRATTTLEIAEPSPLFWEHFSARVREGIAADTPHAAWSWPGRREAMRLAAAMAIVVAVVSTVWLVRDVSRRRVPTTATQEQTAFTPIPGHNGEVEPGVDADNAEVWAVLTAAASDMAIEEARAAGMKPHPAAVDRAVQRMTAAELHELGRLLQSELKRSSN